MREKAFLWSWYYRVLILLDRFYMESSDLSCPKMSERWSRRAWPYERKRKEKEKEKLGKVISKMQIVM